MVIIKTPEQIAGIKRSCQLLATVMSELVLIIKPGISTKEINDLSEKIIKDGGGRPSFKGYKASSGGVLFPSAVCTSINDIVVHGPATSVEPLKEGSIIGLDLGIELNGYYSDMAITLPVGRVKPEVSKLLAVTKQALENGILAIKPANTISDISRAIEDTITPHNYGIIRSFAGHGVGLKVHEDPWIPNYVDNSLTKHLNIELKPGMILALEPMVSIGDGEVTVLEDGWSVQTVDHSLSAHFEHTVLVTETGHEILTEL